MLQKSVITGLFFVVGIGLSSPIMLLGAITAVLSSLVIAYRCRFDAELISSGLYGYNAALIGIAVFFFLPPSLLSFTLAIFGGALSSTITHFLFAKLKNSPEFPIFTVPFIISLWLLLLLDKQAADALVSDDIITPTTLMHSNDFYVIMRGVTQVMFQDYWLSGVIFTLGVFLHSNKAAFWTVLASTLTLIITRIFNFSEELIIMGIYGFNACLTAIALAEYYSKGDYHKFFPIFLGIVISIAFVKSFEYFDIPALTAPFVLASWSVMNLVKIKSNGLREH